MVTIIRAGYILLLSYNPCDIFTYYNVTEMHGLSIAECQVHINTPQNAYIAGLSNYVPKESGVYYENDDRFVFINLNRCNNDVETMGLLLKKRH
jgi:hypothetical protein